MKRPSTTSPSRALMIRPPSSSDTIGSSRDPNSPSTLYGMAGGTIGVGVGVGGIGIGPTKSGQPGRTGVGVGIGVGRGVGVGDS